MFIFPIPRVGLAPTIACLQDRSLTNWANGDHDGDWSRNQTRVDGIAVRCLNHSAIQSKADTRNRTEVFSLEG